MFGTYRTLLALMVVFQHLGGLGMLGGYAVFGFYILSGYLMTLIMHDSYGYSASGVARYALNRFLRIYPLYWVACTLSVVLILTLGKEFAAGLHGAIAIPDAPASILRNLFLIFEHTSSPRLTPPAWALTVELFFYIAIGLGLSRTPGRTLLWFGVSLLYTGIVNYKALGLYYTYYSIPAASLAFATGAFIFHYRARIEAAVRPLQASIAPHLLFVLVLLNFLGSSELNVILSYGFYVNYLLNALLVVSLADRRRLSLIANKQDKWLGDLSYPIYLVHYQAGLMVLATGVGLARGQLMFAVAALPVIFALAWLFARSLEVPIERVRARVKAGKGQAAA